jgi:hypothetical protein
MLRSEAYQLVNQELIKALSDSKQLAAAPSPPKTQQPIPSVNISDVERPVDTQSCSHHRKTKLNCQKPVVKVIRDMLTKKWIFVKRNEQLSNLPLPSRRNGPLKRIDS